MMPTLRNLLIALCVGASSLPADEVQITEFMASNARTFADQFGKFPDWIELYNSGTAPVRLNGWTLTDDAGTPGKWSFPDVEIGASSFLVVFASGDERRDPGAPLGVNFKLSSDGEFLGLFNPNGELVSSFAPEYPQQQLDASFGLPMETSLLEAVAEGAAGSTLVPRSTSELGDDWNLPEFDDSTWTPATTAVGFDAKLTPTLDDVIATDVGASMRDRNASIFLRLPFELTTVPERAFLRLRIKYNGGFVAYLNGVEVARRNAPERVRVTSSATSGKNALQARRFEEVPLSVGPEALRTGSNVLALQAMSRSRSTADFLFAPALDLLEVTAVDAASPGYFAAPTPGLPNRTSIETALVAAPTFQPPGGTFTGTVAVSIEASSEAIVRYTLDGSEPDENAPVYKAPLDVRATTHIRARAFRPGFVPSLPVTAGYYSIAAGLETFSSTLPLLVVSTGGRELATSLVPMHASIFDVGTGGRSALSSAPDFASPIGLKIRGNTSAGFPKKSYGLEIRDEVGRDREVEVLGLPKESDWILHGPYTLDRSLMHNAIVFEVSRSIGRYAVRTRFVEVFLSEEDHFGPSTYHGVYTLMEKITIGKDRVDIEKLTEPMDSEPEIRGGYLLKIDKLDPGDQGFTAGGQPLLYVDPKEEEIVERPAQQAWIQSYIDEFGATLAAEDFSVPAASPEDRQYAQFIDVGAWIDHHLLNELSRNSDALSLSNYLYKARDGKLVQGPLWDQNVTLGFRPDAPHTGWVRQRFFSWWGRLFEDEAFASQYAERWRELRSGPLATERLHAIVDGFTDELREAQARNFERWEISTPPGGWEVGEVARLKSWVSRRTEWMDGELQAIPHRSRQLPGDVNQDGRLNILDPVALLRMLQEEAELPCETVAASTQLADANGDQRADLSDAVHLLNHFFLRGAAPSLGRDCITLLDCGNVCPDYGDALAAE